MSEIMLNTNQITSVPENVIKKLVAESLVEDIADGDITAQLAEDVDDLARVTIAQPHQGVLHAEVAKPVRLALILRVAHALAAQEADVEAG